MAVDGPVRHVVVRVLVTLRRSCIVCTDIPQIHWDDDVCAFGWNGYKTGKGAGKRGPNGAGTWCRGKGPDEWASGMRDGVGKKGGKKGFKAANQIATVTKTKDTMETQATAKVKVRARLRLAANCGEQDHIGVNCPYAWTNSADEEDDQGSSWEKEPASCEAPDHEGE